MKVRATQIGYFEHLRRRIDDVFTIPDEPRRKLRDRVEMEHEEVVDGAGAVAKIPKKRFPVDGPLTKSIVDKKGTVPVAFSERWMRPVNAAAPERTTSSKEALQQFHDDKLLERAGASPAGATGDAEVI